MTDAQQIAQTVGIVVGAASCCEQVTEERVNAVAVKLLSTPERKYIGGRSKNASRTDARRAAPDARPRPGRVTPSSALQFDQ